MFKKIDGFIVGLMCMIALAFFFPKLKEYHVHEILKPITNIGTSLIFFFYGLKLSPLQMREGVNNYKLHLLVQLSSFVLFPAIILLLRPFVKTDELNTLWLALFFMAALPSTVSSSVVMVSLAKGNIPAAIFNSSISGLIGIILTPFWVSLFMKTNNPDYNVIDSIISLVIKILLPVTIGLALNRFLGNTARKYGRYLTMFDKFIILSIVYSSFSHSFNAGIFESINAVHLFFAAIIILIVFIIMYAIIYFISVELRFSREDRITAVFCGSKKSLIHGSVMANVLFKGMATQGIFLVPIMIYHSLQLIIISFIAQKMRKR